MNFKSSIELAFKDSFSAGFTQAKNSFAGMRSSLDKINQNQSMIRLASDLSQMTAMTEPLRQSLSTALDQPSIIAGNLDSSLRNIQAVTGDTTKVMGGIRKELLLIGGKALGGPRAITAAYYDVASGVTEVSARMSTLQWSSKLAEAGQASLGTATNGMIKVMNAYSFSADKAEFAADVFTATVGKGVGTMEEFVSSMAPIAGLASTVGVGFDSLGSAMAFITSKGQSAGAASTQLKAVITSLLNPNSRMIELLNSMGIQSGSAMIKQYGLAGSLEMIKTALGGSNDAMAQVLGSQESLQGAIALTNEGFKAFETSFQSSMNGITKRAQGVQLQSIEAKMGKLNAASEAMQAQVGNDINQIKGFFIDMKTGFLSNVVNPLLSSPVGPAFSKIAAFAGMGANAILQTGGAALNTAAQISVLAANVQNAGGIMNLFKSTLGLLGAPLKGIISFGQQLIFRLFGIGTASAAAATGTGTMGAASAASAGGIGVATGATTAFGVSIWAALWPVLLIIGAIALIAAGVYLLIKNWKTVGPFFGNLWKGISGFFVGAWNFIVGLFKKAWGFIQIILFPFIGIPLLIIKNWGVISDFFSGLWNGIVEGFKKAIGFIGGIIDGVSGFFKGLFGGAKDSGAALNTAFAAGINQTSGLPGKAFSNSIAGIDSQMPHSDAKEGPLSRLTESGKAFSRTFASGIDAEEDTLSGVIEKQFSRLLPEKKSIQLDNITIPGKAQTGGNTIHIHKLYIQAEEVRTMLDFLRKLMDIADVPVLEGEAV